MDGDANPMSLNDTEKWRIIGFTALGVISTVSKQAWSSFINGIFVIS